MAEMRIPPHLFVKSGVWYVKKVIHGQRLRQTTGVKVGGEKELKKAIQIQKAIEASWDTVGTGPKHIPSLSAWWEIYREAYSVKKASVELDDYLIGPALTKWKHVRVNHITKSMCQSFINSLTPRWSQGTANRMRSLTQAVLEQALEDGLLVANPFRKIKRVKDVKRDRVLSAEEQPLLMAKLTPYMQRWLVVLLGTGMRFAEAQALQPEHVDRERRVIHVQAEAAKYGKGRDVPLYPEVEAAIDAQWAAEGRCWPSSNNSMRESLGRAAKNAGIPHFHPHCVRHTFATRYLAAGGDIYFLSRILGHAKVSMTEEQYVHTSSADLVERSKALELGLWMPVAPEKAPAHITA